MNVYVIVCVEGMWVHINGYVVCVCMLYGEAAEMKIVVAYVVMNEWCS